MSDPLFIVKKNILSNLIKKVSNNHGGDDPIWLNDYIAEILLKNKDDLDKAITCFESL